MKLLKSLLCSVLLVFAFILTSCGKLAREKHNEEISTSDLAGIIYDLSFTNNFIYFDEETFVTDLSDNNYEIGYALEAGFTYEARKHGIRNVGSYARCLGHHKVRRNKITKELDKEFFAEVSEDDEIKTYDIISDYMYNDDTDSRSITMTLRMYSEVNDSITSYRNIELTNKTVFDYIDFDFWTVPSKNIKHDKSMNKYYFRYNGSDWIKCDIDNFDYASKVDFVFKDKFGKEIFYMTLTTLLKK